MMIEYLRVLFAPYTGYRRVESVEASVGTTKEKWEREFFSSGSNFENFSPEISGSKGDYHGPDGVGVGLSIWV
jgi:hypothetical protein